MGDRAKRGSVQIIEQDGRLRLSYRVEGKRYRLLLRMSDTPINRHLAAPIAAAIERDIAYGEFDPTQQKYKDMLPSHRDQTPQAAPALPTMAELFEQFTEHRRAEGTSGQTISAKYQPLLANLQRFGEIESQLDARRFMDMLKERQSNLVWNQNLGLLQTFMRWGIESGRLENNLFTGINPLRTSQATRRRKAFTKDEISRILATVKTDRYYHHYHDFCFTLLHLGLRPAEAIGLRWKDIDLSRRQVTICESLARSEAGKTSGSSRIRKGTKTGNSRDLDMNEPVYKMFLNRHRSDTSPEQLIFLSPKGNPIDDHSFSQRCWKTICKKAGVDHRPPYTARHTTLSHMIDQGATLPQVANVAGHKNNRMVAEVYGHMVNRPKMPDFTAYEDSSSSSTSAESR